MSSWQPWQQVPLPLFPRILDASWCLNLLVFVYWEWKFSYAKVTAWINRLRKCVTVLASNRETWQRSQVSGQLRVATCWAHPTTSPSPSPSCNFLSIYFSLFSLSLSTFFSEGDTVMSLVRSRAVGFKMYGTSRAYWVWPETTWIMISKWNADNSYKCHWHLLGWRENYTHYYCHIFIYLLSLGHGLNNDDSYYRIMVLQLINWHEILVIGIARTINENDCMRIH